MFLGTSRAHLFSVKAFLVTRFSWLCKPEKNDSATLGRKTEKKLFVYSIFLSPILLRQKTFFFGEAGLYIHKRTIDKIRKGTVSSFKGGRPKERGQVAFRILAVVCRTPLMMRWCVCVYFSGGKIKSWQRSNRTKGNFHSTKQEKTLKSLFRQVRV